MRPRPRRPLPFLDSRSLDRGREPHPRQPEREVSCESAECVKTGVRDQGAALAPCSLTTVHYLPTRRNHIEENRKVMRHAACQHKQMPCGMEVTQPVESEEDNPQRVGHSARAQPK